MATAATRASPSTRRRGDTTRIFVSSPVTRWPRPACLELPVCSELSVCSELPVCSELHVVCPVHSTVSPPALRASGRSVEHTSELQSQSNLGCRLLLEKNKKQT